MYLWAFTAERFRGGLRLESRDKGSGFEVKPWSPSPQSLLFPATTPVHSLAISSLAVPSLAISSLAVPHHPHSVLEHGGAQPSLPNSKKRPLWSTGNLGTLILISARLLLERYFRNGFCFSIAVFDSSHVEIELNFCICCRWHLGNRILRRRLMRYSVTRLSMGLMLWTLQKL